MVYHRKLHKNKEWLCPVCDDNLYNYGWGLFWCGSCDMVIKHYKAVLKKGGDKNDI